MRCQELKGHLLGPEHHFPVSVHLHACLSVPSMHGRPVPFCLCQICLKATQVDIVQDVWYPIASVRIHRNSAT